MAVLDSSHPVWNHIDGVLVINLDKSTERYGCMCRDIGSKVPAEKWHRLSAVDGRELPTYAQKPWFAERTMDRAAFWGGTAGCALSHKKALETARDNGWRNVLILEDDVQLATVDAGAWDVVAEALAGLHGRYMFYLGGNRPVPYGRRVGGQPSVWRIEGILGSHAYIVSQELYRPILELLAMETGVWEWLSIYRAVDVFYRDFVSALPGVELYFVSPVLLRQATTTSDISGGAAFDADMGSTPPKDLRTVKGLLHRMAHPFHRLKVRLNSIRTHRRALNGGLPGRRKRSK